MTRSCSLAIATLIIALQSAAQNMFTEIEADGVRAFLRENFRQTNACIVIGLTDERTNRIIATGKLDNGTAAEANGDTVFFIGSVSKTFTALLLLDAVERGEVNMDDPVAKFLPTTVKVPERNGEQVRLIDLATHTAGFPVNPDNMTGKDAREQYETYTVEKMYAWLSTFKLSRDPGTEYQYSNVGMALLGHVLALRAGTDFESLVVNRICRPLGMDSTCVTLPPRLQARERSEHGQTGRSQTTGQTMLAH